MSCQGCSVGSNGKPGGCKSNGGCSSGGCNRLNTYDWLSKMDIYDPSAFEYVEVSFKNGSRKDFYRNEVHTRTITGDTVVVESQNGYDIGKISLSGELVRLQMKKKRKEVKGISYGIIRRANERDLERLQEARAAERDIMVRSRVIARSLSLDMKIGDVEFQGDKRKATFYYVADGRVDFRELIRHFAKEFKVKIEMRQIGARQESARIGGIGSCGRELCCSTWLTDFKSVSTTAARYQNLAINQSKLSGQCGRLKCCLNYELDTYMDALESFPKGIDALFTQAGKAVLVKTDIFKRIMYFAYEKEGFRGQFYPLDVDRVKEIAEMNKQGEKPLDLQTLRILETLEEEEEMDFDADLTGVIELPPEKRRKKRRKSRGGRDKSSSKGGDTSSAWDNRRKEQAQTAAGAGDTKEKPENKTDIRRDNRNNRSKGRRDENKKATITATKSGDKPQANTTREERKTQRTEKPATNKDAKSQSGRSRRRGGQRTNKPAGNKPAAKTNEPKSSPKAANEQPKDKKEQAKGTGKSRRSTWKNRKKQGENKTSDKPTTTNKSAPKSKDKPGDTKPTSRRDRRNNRNRNKKNDKKT